AVNEQCHQYKECGGYTAFTNAGKPVFNAEYQKLWREDPDARAQMCAGARAANLRTLVLPLKLNDAFRYSCD
ncbi:MAG TPA: endo alpha-1,4 polygalactosaminidase, partial [Chloroflexota bacterium]|nr:endo alpha-1,4 polygalactosaminidase [Chloroflexota bacterium]